MTKASRVVVLGNSFAGYTAAIELKKVLGGAHEVIVVAPSSKFVFIPSLIWVPFGLRKEEDITFDTRPVYDQRGISFVESLATRIELEKKRVLTSGAPIDYDYLLVATGPKVDFDMIPGLGPRRHSWSICSLHHALQAKEAWDAFLQDPGPVIVGATQGAACFGAAYEFVLNVRYQLKQRGLLDKAPITFLTAEPFLSHFGIGGFGNGQALCEQLFDMYDIAWRTNCVMKEVTQDSVVLEDGERIPGKFKMIIPRFLGVDAVRNSPGLANDAGFVETNDAYQHPKYPEVYAAGIAAQVDPPSPTPVKCGVPKTGYPSEQMAKTAAHNIAVMVTGQGEVHTLPFGNIKALCIMDTGNMGMMILGDHMLPPRQHELIVPGPQAHWAKVAFEKHFLGTRRRGIV